MAGKTGEWCQHDGGHEVPDFAPAAIWSFFASLRWRAVYGAAGTTSAAAGSA